MLLKEYSLAVRKDGGEIFVHRCSTGRVSFHLDNDVRLLSISHLNTKYGVGINELWPCWSQANFLGFGQSRTAAWKWYPFRHDEIHGPLSIEFINSVPDHTHHQTSRPLRAKTWANPCPMVPAPTTKTLWMFSMFIPPFAFRYDLRLQQQISGRKIKIYE